jgi:ATP-binding cassette subfamily B protein/ATP-binding cassette subfamily C protein
MQKIKHVFWKFLSFCFSCSKPYFFFLILSILISSALTIFNAYSLSLLLTSLQEKSYTQSLIVAGIIVGANLLFYFLNKLFKKLTVNSFTVLSEAIDNKITKKLMNLPFEYLEDPYYLDLKERAKFAIENQGSIQQLFTSIQKVLESLITLAGLISIIVLFDAWLVLILAAGIVIEVLVTVFTIKEQVSFFKKLIPINRKYSYYLNTLTNEHNAKDFRLSSQGDLLLNNIKKYSDEIEIYFAHLANKLGAISSIGAALKYAVIGVIYGFITYKTVTNGLDIGLFSLYVSASITFGTSFSRLLSASLEFSQYISYVTPFVELTTLKDRQEEKDKKVFSGDIKTIEFRNLSFSYPRSEDLILKDISFKVDKGQKISVVGLNGAGKTTLVKLLCKLYSPSKGAILVNDINIDEYEFSSYISSIAALFQDYKLFAYSIKDNISPYNDNAEYASQLASTVGLKDKIDSLPNGIDTLLTKSFDTDGTELSGGEEQKIAIGRALSKNASLVILDEPTSALDPLAESQIYENFNELVGNKTAFYISHRMSSSVFCDKILVIENGEIIDFDSHKKLMLKTESLYYKMFTTQAKNYRK